MAVSRAQQVGIWIIAVALTVGTIFSFAAIIIANDNESSQQQALDEATAQYQADYAAYQAEVAAAAAEMSDEYYDQFVAYESRVSSFDADTVTELKTEDLEIGDGEEIAEGDSFTAYYIGWNPNGEIFDSSIEEDSLRAPFEAQPGGVISGWSDGVVGMKVGGVRELTIPADQAYGETGSGDLIEPNMPLKFVVMVVPPIDIAEPEIPEILLQSYGL